MPPRSFLGVLEGPLVGRSAQAPPPRLEFLVLAQPVVAPDVLFP